MSDTSDAFEQVLSSLSLLGVGGRPITDTLQHVAELARDAIEAADYVAITTVRDGTPETAAATDPTVLVIDQAQYDADSGPCLDSMRRGETLPIESTADDDRWPEFSGAALAHGVHSTLSLPLLAAGESVGALNLYGRRPRSFSPADRAQAERFAKPAAVLLANASLYWRARRLAEELETALASRAIIEQAKGMLMGEQGIDADTAFDLLRRASQRENVKVRVIAQRLVDRATRGRPDRAGDRQR